MIKLRLRIPWTIARQHDAGLVTTPDHSATIHAIGQATTSRLAAVGSFHRKVGAQFITQVTAVDAQVQAASRRKPLVSACRTRLAQLNHAYLKATLAVLTEMNIAETEPSALQAQIVRMARISVTYRQAVWQLLQNEESWHDQESNYATGISTAGAERQWCCHLWGRGNQWQPTDQG